MTAQAHEGLAGDPARDDLLILVDGLDREVGTATKAQAHAEGLLHRAFSVVLVRPAGGQAAPDAGDQPKQLELLLAQRAAGKYHSSGLWANSCCSHPRAGETVLDSAYRRVHEELGCEATGLRELCAFAYRAEFADGLCEHEFDHVLVGACSGEPAPDPSEVGALRWVTLDDLAAELAEQPGHFAAWAPMVLTLAMAQLA
ncbi:MAG: isopentenyl-diphosphate Delta-isomerase [Coriobacteriaceae bacterium]|nr:isopentenyl-diphosphate Delta-isomerase [Coriobacteriaceae bacterium]